MSERKLELELELELERKLKLELELELKMQSSMQSLEPGGLDGEPARADAAQDVPTPRWMRLGIGLMVVSAILWLPLPAVPFLSLETGHKAALGGGLLIGAEATWWFGAALVGPEAVRRSGPWLRDLRARWRQARER